MYAAALSSLCMAWRSRSPMIAPLQELPPKDRSTIATPPINASRSDVAAAAGSSRRKRRRSHSPTPGIRRHQPYAGRHFPALKTRFARGIAAARTATTSSPKAGKNISVASGTNTIPNNAASTVLMAFCNRIRAISKGHLMGAGMRDRFSLIVSARALWIVLSLINIAYRGPGGL